MATKPKRKLTEITFEHDGAHVALVSKQQAGPANGHDYAVVLKSGGLSKEAIQKMQQVQVTLELPEFLRKFFGVYYDDAEVLARMLGYEPPADSNAVCSMEDYYQKRLASFEIMKSLESSKDQLKDIAQLTEEQYLNLLQDQEVVEKALLELESKESDSLTNVAESDNSTNAGVEKSVEPSGSKIKKSKKDNMKIEDTKTNVEMIEKSALEAVQKALDDSKVELQKANELIAKYQEAEKQAVIKSKTDKITALVKDEKIQAAIVKAALSLESDDDFGAFLAAIQSMVANIETTQEFVEKSALFQEQGADASDESNDQESLVASILKAKLTNKAK